MDALTQAPQHEEFRHEAFFYSGQEEFLARSVDFIREGIAGREPVLVVVGAAKIEALREALGPDADGVHFADMAQVGSNPARIIPAWRDFLTKHAGPGNRARGIGEPICAERSAAELVECQRHESLLNLAFADSPGFYLMCPYDIAALSPRVLLEARRSHPYLTVNGREHDNVDYSGLEEIAAPFSDPLPRPAVQPDWKVFGARALAELREFVTDRADRVGLGEERTADLSLAVTELASNSVRHGGGGGTLRVWSEGDALICEVTDKGTIDEPLVGRERPTPSATGGHGMWLANQLCDLVQVRALAHGSVVRLHMRLER